MSTVHDITRLIGNTGLVKLQRLVKKGSADVYVKMESLNPTGSVKDRVALAMVQAAEHSGELKTGGTIVEATSGNMGVALAMVAAARGYRCVLIMLDSTSTAGMQLITHYGAEIILTPEVGGMIGGIVKAKEIFCKITGAYMPQQFDNPVNSEVHSKTTAQEIWSATDGNIDAFVCGVGTGGTISGVTEVIRLRNDALKVIAVEPRESPVLSGGTHTPHGIQGLGMGFVPKNLDMDLIDSIEQVSTEEAVVMCRRLCQEEGLLTGLSSGANVCVALTVADRLGEGRVVVTMVHDGGQSI